MNIERCSVWRIHMKEEEVKKRAGAWLEGQGYKIVTVSPERGRTARKLRRGRKLLAPMEPDIRARRGTEYYFVEAKGDPASSNQLYTAIGQLVSKMAAKTPTKYAIAVSPGYENLLHLIPPEVQERFKINVIMVKPEREKSKRLPEVLEI